MDSAFRLIGGSLVGPTQLIGVGGSAYAARMLSRCGPRRILEWAVLSNLYLSLGASIIAYVTTGLLGEPFCWALAFVPFSQALFVYTVNRYTDRGEDSVNLPDRHAYWLANARPHLLTTFLLFVAGAAIAYHHGETVFVFATVPVVFGIAYSVLRLKRFLLVKNVFVGMVWSSVTLLVAAWFHHYSSAILACSVFVLLAFIVNTIVFDIKDINGDRHHGIVTLPAKLGIGQSKLVCQALNFINALWVVSAVWAGLMPTLGLSLSLMVLYQVIYVQRVTDGTNGLFFGAVVDGEFFALLIAFVFGRFL